MARVAFLIPSFEGGGAERVALSLVDHFVSLGHHVDLLIMRGGGPLLTLLPRQVRVIALHAPRMRNLMKPLWRYLRVERPDALQAFMWPVTSIAVVARMLSGIPTRLMLSDHTMISYHHMEYGRARKCLLRQSIRWLYPLADSRVIVSQQAADDLASYAGLRRETLRVISNPLGPPSSDYVTTPVIEQLWNGPCQRVITVGSLKSEKNHRVLLSAFTLLRRTHGGARLMIVGEGKGRQAIEAQARALGVEGEVVMPGFTLDPKPFYASADLFVLSSDYEGYPLVLVEAMSAGLRIVSTDCPSGPREILEDGKFGRLVPCRNPRALADAMATALDAPHDPEPVKARARILSEHSFAEYERLMLGLGIQDVSD